MDVVNDVRDFWLKPTALCQQEECCCQNVWPILIQRLEAFADDGSVSVRQSHRIKRMQSNQPLISRQDIPSLAQQSELPLQIVYIIPYLPQFHKGEYHRLYFTMAGLLSSPSVNLSDLSAMDPQTA